MRKYLMTFWLMFLVSVTYNLYAKEKQEIPKDFFMGRWGGRIEGVLIEKGPPPKDYPFSVELVGRPGSAHGDLTHGVYSEAWMRLDATYPKKFTFVDSVGCIFDFKLGYPRFSFGSVPDVPNVSSYSDVLKLGHIMHLSTLFQQFGFKVQAENKNLIHLVESEKHIVVSGSHPWETVKATGELHRIYVKKDTLGKTVQINEPIKTDKFTQREIVVPAISEIPDFTYEIGKAYVFGNTDCIFTSENEMVLSSGGVIIFEDVNWGNIDMDKVVSWKPEISDMELGEIATKLDKLREEGYDFKVQTPQAGCGVRRTQFITKVDKDETTTLIVLDGEVEFSDKEKKKTGLVKMNQKSVVKPGGLPSEPVQIDPNQIPRWWE